MQKSVSKFQDLKLELVLLIIVELSGLYSKLICYKMTRVRGQQIMKVKSRSVNLLIIHSQGEQNLKFIIALILYHFNDELTVFFFFSGAYLDEYGSPKFFILSLLVIYTLAQDLIYSSQLHTNLLRLCMLVPVSCLISLYGHPASKIKHNRSSISS